MLDEADAPGTPVRTSKKLEQWLQVGFALVLDTLSDDIELLKSGRRSPEETSMWEDLPPIARPHINVAFLVGLVETVKAVRGKLFRKELCSISSRAEEVALILAVEAAKGGDETADEDKLDEYCESVGDPDIRFMWSPELDGIDKDSALGIAPLGVNEWWIPYPGLRPQPPLLPEEGNA